MVGVRGQTHCRGQIKIRSCPKQYRAGIVEIRLPLFLRRAQRVEHAVAAVDSDGATPAGEGNGLADPVAGVGAGEQRVLEDRIEAFGAVVEGIGIPDGIQQGQARADSLQG